MAIVYGLFVLCLYYFFFFKQKTAYEMRISDWSSDVCSSDLALVDAGDQILALRPGLAEHGLLPGAGRDQALALAGQRDAGGLAEAEAVRHLGDLVDAGAPRRLVEKQDRKSTRLNSSH